MAVLAYCWLITEAIIIPDGFLKLTNTTSEATEKVESCELVQKYCNRNQSPTSCSTSSCVAPISCQIKVVQVQEKIGFEEENYKFKDDQVSCDDDDNDDDLFSIYISCGSSSSDSDKEDSSISSSTKDANVNDNYTSSSVCSSKNSPEADKLHMANEYPLLALNSNFPLPQDLYSTSLCCFSSAEVVEPQEANYNRREQVKDLDAFYDKYTERMRWFDVLNYDRTCGIRTPSSIESNIEGVDLSVSPYTSWGKTARKKLLRSIESDFELVYVAQACLSWEALYHQYRKVEALASSTSQNGVFYDNVAGDFQKFQILLERFMEDERCEGKRLWNYVRGRFSHRSLLQVPQVSGFFEQEMENMKIEALNIKEVLKSIERCIEAFWVFVRTDEKKPWWKLRSFLWTCPPVEDPRDLKLLTDVTRQLQKKELWLKDSQGKQRCWFRKVVNPVEESQRKVMMFTMIDIKLVSRVLQLPVLSSSQIKWCQEKLGNIGFEEGKIVRACNCGPLFPP
ncbi:conserved hypothetical protein [Ricinus communis]|uniref:Uncharacterized protein n=1 Tax=Ricinus communis TaxID=3988 RepID=B9T0T8_RICCO|nr:conserved hypothetical protein [Ricinus communis]